MDVLINRETAAMADFGCRRIHEQKLKEAPHPGSIKRYNLSQSGILLLIYINDRVMF